MRTDRFHYPPAGAYSPWGKLPLAERVPVASEGLLGGGSFDATPLTFIPAFDFSPVPAGLVAVVDRHDDSEWKIPNDGKSGARPGNLTARSGNVPS